MTLYDPKLYDSSSLPLSPCTYIQRREHLLTTDHVWRKVTRITCWPFNPAPRRSDVAIRDPWLWHFMAFLHIRYPLIPFFPFSPITMTPPLWTRWPQLRHKNSNKRSWKVLKSKFQTTCTFSTSKFQTTCTFTRYLNPSFKQLATFTTDAMSSI